VQYTLSTHTTVPYRDLECVLYNWEKFLQHKSIQ